MDSLRFNILIKHISEWAEQDENTTNILLVGSWARNQANENSDVDLVIIVKNSATLLEDLEWVKQFGSTTTSLIEDWGLMQSIRTFYSHGFEVEYGITTKQWLNTDPIDPGTFRVISDGCKIILDKDKGLKNLLSKAA